MAREMPAGKLRLLYFGTLLLLSVYYVNYAFDFNEGVVSGARQWTMALKGAAILIICAALWPVDRALNRSDMLPILFALCGLSYALALGFSESAANDLLFLNTLAQVPILLMLTHSSWNVDFQRWFGFIGAVLAAQVCIDALVRLSGKALWASQQFVGGLGNPSAFGLACATLFAFYLYRFDKQRWAIALAVVMATGAIMTSSLFAAAAVALIFILWAAMKPRLMATAAALVCVALALVLALSGGAEEETRPLLFVTHKIKAVLSAVGLSGDQVSSYSVSIRVTAHRATADAIAKDPWALITGHPNNVTYWPMDSQLLTYLGSFGLILTAIFLALHLWFMVLAARARLGFCFVSLAVFGLIFATNRILDYFPIATLYFMSIAMAYKPFAHQRVAA